MKIFRLLRKNEGATAVEFAIVLPLFLIFVFGIIEFGIIMYNKAMITNASREGARYGILYTIPAHTDVQVEGRVSDKLVNDEGNSRLISLGDSSEVAIPTATFKTDASTGDEYIVVRVDYQYSFLIMHLLWDLIPGLSEGDGSIPLSSTTTMRMELQTP